jgi:hypothetical protein
LEFPAPVSLAPEQEIEYWHQRSEEFQTEQERLRVKLKPAPDFTPTPK